MWFSAKSAPYCTPGMNILLDTLQRIVILRRMGTNVALFLDLPLHVNHDSSCMFGRGERRQWPAPVAPLMYTAAIGVSDI